MPADGEIDYSVYSRLQLGEALHQIDRRRYPINFANLTSELARRSHDQVDGDSLVGRLQGLRGRFRRTPWEYVSPFLGVIGLIWAGAIEFRLLLEDAERSHLYLLGIGALAILIVGALVAIGRRLFLSYDCDEGQLRCLLLSRVLWERPTATIWRVTVQRNRFFRVVQAEWPDASERLYMPESMASVLLRPGYLEH
jgi:hypothetical protein